MMMRTQSTRKQSGGGITTPTHQQQMYSQPSFYTSNRAANDSDSDDEYRIDEDGMRKPKLPYFPTGKGYQEGLITWRKDVERVIPPPQHAKQKLQLLQEKLRTSVPSSLATTAPRPKRAPQPITKPYRLPMLPSQLKAPPPTIPEVDSPYSLAKPTPEQERCEKERPSWLHSKTPSPSRVSLSPINSRSASVPLSKSNPVDVKTAAPFNTKRGSISPKAKSPTLGPVPTAASSWKEIDHSVPQMVNSEDFEPVSREESQQPTPEELMRRASIVRHASMKRMLSKRKIRGRKKLSELLDPDGSRSQSPPQNEGRVVGVDVVNVGSAVIAAKALNIPRERISPFYL